tara:strand:+ start:195 stop:464 length:270 start_codon:yes stop_codon:yes gene_type:complete
MIENKTYPFVMIEVQTDTDKSSETYKEKYVHVSLVPFKDGRADSDNMIIVKADRFTIEHHSLNAKDQIKPSKGNLQVLRSQDFEDLDKE